jgi:uncharacterized membrane protein YfcA
VDHVTISLAVFLGGLVSGFSGFAFSAAAGAQIGVAIPALLAGTLAGMALLERVDDRKFRLAVLALLFVSGCLMFR